MSSKKMNPKFLDNSGWDAKVEWEIEDPEIFEKTKENPYAKDYVLIAISRVVSKTRNTVM